MSELSCEVYKKFIAGDTDSFKQIIEFYQRRVFHMGLRLFANQFEAADFTQDVFIKVFEQKQKYDSKRPFKSWFLTLAINLGRDYLRRRKKICSLENAIFEPSLDSKIEQKFIQEEEQSLVQQALQVLKPKYREALVLRFEEELSIKEMAKILGTTLGTVKSRLSRGLRIFKQAYKSLEGEKP